MNRFLSLLCPFFLLGLLTACGKFPVPEEPVTMSLPTAQQPLQVVRILVDDRQLSPSMISVKKGANVRLQIVGVSGTHGFSIRGMGLTVKVQEGQTITVGLPTDAPGIFSYYCSPVCGEGREDTEGQIVIAE